MQPRPLGKQEPARKTAKKPAGAKKAVRQTVSPGFIESLQKHGADSQLVAAAKRRNAAIRGK